MTRADRVRPRVRGRLLPRLGLLVLGLSWFAGCANDLETLYGHELGVAQSAVYYCEYGKSSYLITDYLIAFSNIDGVCAYMDAGVQPLGPGDWVVSVWQMTEADVTEVGGFFATWENGEVVEREAEEASIQIDDLPLESEALEGAPMKGRIVLEFSNGDRVETRFKAYFCSKNLLNGLQ